MIAMTQTAKKLGMLVAVAGSSLVACLLLFGAGRATVSGAAATNEPNFSSLPLLHGRLLPRHARGGGALT
jgi:hypothetical protein